MSLEYLKRVGAWLLDVPPALLLGLLIIALALCRLVFVLAELRQLLGV